MATLLISLLCLCLGIAIGVVARWIYAKSKLTSAEQKAQPVNGTAAGSCNDSYGMFRNWQYGEPVFGSC